LHSNPANKILGGITRIEVFGCNTDSRSCHLAFTGHALKASAKRIPMRADETLEIGHARTVGGSPSAFLCAFADAANRRNTHSVALYGAFALIAAVVIGSLSVHPF
jgi:hypothetical protein